MQQSDGLADGAGGTIDLPELASVASALGKKLTEEELAAAVGHRLCLAFLLPPWLLYYAPHLQ